MKLKLLIWVLFLPLLIFFAAMFYIDVSLSSGFPGTSFWISLGDEWYGSIWFYAIVLILSFLVCFSILHKPK
ncbi:hypothetical protein [Ureibacillus acetophenoni]|uniref:Uncharacterized protein n=1 Tax=Ureibacillus acetophenoni TaxID=614649 RepID=A0A285UQ17_9BACL|nr:hypothetical protein [Ureibacillus acetophenoni]SOC43843.1 hypothetical protein SAMN05877842_11767 [Ureibacillus acetophenoni]